MFRMFDSDGFDREQSAVLEHMVSTNPMVSATSCRRGLELLPEAEEDDAPPASQVPPPPPPSPPPQPAAAAAGRSRAGGMTPKLAQDTAMHEHLQKPVDPRRLASSKVHTVTMPLLVQP